MMRELVENIKQISIDLQNLSEKILQIYSKKEEKDKEVKEGWYKFIQMVYKDSLDKCFNHPQIYSFIHHVVNSLEDNQVSFNYYKSYYDEAIKIFNIFQFFDSSFYSLTLNRHRNDSPKRLYKIKNKKKRYEIRISGKSSNSPPSKARKQNGQIISQDLTEMISASTAGSIMSSFFSNNPSTDINKINKNYNMLNDCLNYEHELFYKNSHSSTFNIFNNMSPTNKIKNQDLSKILKNNQNIIKSFYPKSHQQSHPQFHQTIYEHIREHEKFLICIYCNNCSSIIEFLDFDAINKINRQIASRVGSYSATSNMSKAGVKINNIGKRERQMYSLSQNQISQNKITLKEDSKFKFKHSKLFPKVNTMMDIFENPVDNENQNRLMKWLQSCCEIKNKWNNLEVKLNEKNENLALKKNGNKKSKKTKLNKDLKIVKDYRDSISDTPSLSTISASNISIKGIWKGLLDDQTISTQTVK